MNREDLMLHPERCPLIFDAIYSKEEKHIIDDIIDGIDDSTLKAKIILSMPILYSNLREHYYDQIDDRFLRACITVSDSNMLDICRKTVYELDTSALVNSSSQLCKSIDFYTKLMLEIKSCKSEEEIVQYLTDSSLFQEIDYKTANHIKHAVLYDITDPDLRMQVIDSMENRVSPELARIHDTAQMMILDFFSKAYNGNIPQEKMEKIQLVLKKTDVLRDDLRVGENGCCNNAVNTINVSNNYEEFEVDAIGTLLHEYLHAMSGIDFVFEPTDVEICHDIEEGMADVFSEIVFNTYVKEHPELLTQLNISDSQYKYVAHSAYDTENSIVRSLLYPKEVRNSDINAIVEYALGDKNNFFISILPQSVIDGMPRDHFGHVMFDTRQVSKEQLYAMNKGNYSNLNKNSMYCVKNEFIEEFEVMDLVQDKPTQEYTSTFVYTNATSSSIFGNGIYDDDEYDEPKASASSVFTDDIYGIDEPKTENNRAKVSTIIFSSMEKAWTDRFRQWNYEAEQIPEIAKKRHDIVKTIQSLKRQKEAIRESSDNIENEIDNKDER